MTGGVAFDVNKESTLPILLLPQKLTKRRKNQQFFFFFFYVFLVLFCSPLVFCYYCSIVCALTAIEKGGDGENKRERDTTALVDNGRCIHILVHFFKKPSIMPCILYRIEVQVIFIQKTSAYNQNIPVKIKSTLLFFSYDNGIVIFV